MSLSTPVLALTRTRFGYRVATLRTQTEYREVFVLVDMSSRFPVSEPDQKRCSTQRNTRAPLHCEG